MDVYQLPNRMTVIAVPFLHATASVVLAVKAGARDDPKAKPGLHHAMEHLMARATAFHTSWESLNKFCERHWLEFNAETDRTTTLFYCAGVPKRNVPRAISFLAEVVRFPLLTEEYFRCEQERLAEEQGEEESSVEEWLEEEFLKVLLPGESQGKQHRCKRYTLKDITRTYQRSFVGSRAVLVLAGALPKSAIRVAEQCFAMLPRGTPPRHRKINYRRVKGKVRLKSEPLKKVQFILGFPVFSLADPRRFALGILRNHFSARISSRLGIRLDSIGMGYTSLDSLWMWDDVGQFSVRVSLFPKKFVPTLRIIAEELRQLVAHGITKRDLAHAKRNLAVLTSNGKFTDPLETALFYARQQLHLGEVITPDRYLAAVQRVQAEEVRAVAGDLFTRRRLILIAAGKVPRRRRAVLEALNILEEGEAV